MPRRIFIAFADKDRAFRDALVMHVTPLLRDRDVTVVDTTTIGFTERVHDARRRFVDTADILLFLLSPSFFAAPETSEDVRRAIERNRDENIPIVPVLIVEVNLAGTPLAGWKILPAPGRPIQSPSNDELLAEVALGLRSVIHEMHSNVAAAATRTISAGELRRSMDASFSEDELEIFYLDLREELSQQGKGLPLHLESIAGRRLPKVNRIGALIQHMQHRGWFDDLVRAVRRERPAYPDGFDR